MSFIYLGLAAVQCGIVYAAYNLMRKDKEGWGWLVFALVISFSAYPVVS